VLILGLFLAIVGFALLGGLVHWWGQRDFGGARSEVSAEDLPGMHTEGRPSQAVVDSGELGIGPFSGGVRHHL
jgi:hypothetical protein